MNGLSSTFSLAWFATSAVAKGKNSCTGPAPSTPHGEKEWPLSMQLGCCSCGWWFRCSKDVSSENWNMGGWVWLLFLFRVFFFFLITEWAMEYHLVICQKMNKNYMFNLLVLSKAIQIYKLVLLTSQQQKNICCCHSVNIASWLQLICACNGLW